MKVEHHVIGFLTEEGQFPFQHADFKVGVANARRRDDAGE
eukprot:CAMPEP_0119144632 /NCGR_PEP_ID=MMETSP1310-20130426/36178_1 /TAXON_ID=464262 /ORGANISM="Genus nov. species nov., Strain RCC2339" /LENGTH=39 /DNA_ID= /DNA_START= /DNA_END= /DNA_ORIENTATION=